MATAVAAANNNDEALSCEHENQKSQVIFILFSLSLSRAFLKSDITMMQKIEPLDHLRPLWIISLAVVLNFELILCVCSDLIVWLVG